MNEEAFLETVRSNPHDEGARGVYADWLQERGDERGEYLRLQLELARTRERLRQLWPRLDPAWLEAVRLPGEGVTEEAAVRAIAYLAWAFHVQLSPGNFDLELMTLRQALQRASEADRDALAEAARRLHAEEQKLEDPDPEYPNEVLLSGILGRWMESAFGPGWQGNVRRAPADKGPEGAKPRKGRKKSP